MTRRGGCRSAAALLMALAASTCVDTTGPPPVALIRVLEGSLSTDVATSLSFTVRIEDASGVAIAGVPLTVSPSEGSGTVVPATPTTGATGQVVLTWTLGETAGSQSMWVGAGEVSIVAEATATPGPVHTLLVLSGEAQTGVVGAPLPDAVVVQARDRFGNAVPGVLMSFEPAQGTVSSELVTTDEVGNARTEWTLGANAGPHSLEAVGAGGSVTISATAVPGPPSAVKTVSGDGQAGQVGAPLSEPAVFDVRDEFGNAAVGVTVTFSGDGSAFPDAPTVDSAGGVSVTWTLGPSAGDQTLAATAGVASTAVRAVAAPGPPAVVEAVSGTGQRSYGTATLEEPIVARVRDEFGNLVPGAQVSFVVTEGAGTVVPPTVESGADGRAQAVWTLGDVAGMHALEARVEGAGPATFSAEAVSGAPAEIRVAGGGAQTAVVATTLPEPIVFQLVDASGTPVPGAPVTMTVLEGGGSLDPDSASTSTTGLVSTAWTLGTGAGTQAISSSFPAAAVSRTVEATALAGPAARVAIESGEGQSARTGTAVPVAPAVFVTDAFENPAPGVPVTFAVDGGGGFATGADQVTNAAGIATIGAWTVGSEVGLNTLSATVAGVGSVTFTASAILGPAFDIEVRFTGMPPSASRQTTFQVAASRWEQLVTGDLPDLPLTPAVAGAGSCGGLDHDAISETIDDLLIFVEVVAIDGAGGILGSAGPCFIRVAGGLSIVGFMRFDEDDIAGLEAAGQFDAVILHEMGHVIGIGVGNWNLILQGQGGPDPFFPGKEALTQYRAAGGAAPSAVPVANTGGQGTRDKHWREAHMGAELMTGFLNIGVPNPLSAITVGALQDMGYTVNLSAADAYVVSSALREKPDALIPLIEIDPPPPIAIDDRGRVVPVRR